MVTSFLFTLGLFAVAFAMCILADWYDSRLL